MSNICRLCKGSRWLISIWPLQYFQCPSCEGKGVYKVFEPESIGKVKTNWKK